MKKHVVTAAGTPTEEAEKGGFSEERKNGCAYLELRYVVYFLDTRPGASGKVVAWSGYKTPAAAKGCATRLIAEGWQQVQVKDRQTGVIIHPAVMPVEERCIDCNAAAEGMLKTSEGALCRSCAKVHELEKANGVTRGCAEC